jgi:hypothetical protein
LKAQAVTLTGALIPGHPPETAGFRKNALSKDALEAWPEKNPVGAGDCGLDRSPEPFAEGRGGKGYTVLSSKIVHRTKSGY